MCALDVCAVWHAAAINPIRVVRANMAAEEAHHRQWHGLMDGRIKG